MNTTQNSTKKILKKFNLIFFIDSEKTYHFKFKYIYVKFFIIFVFILLFSAIFSIVISVKVINKNIELENYIVEFKNNILKSYFTKGFYKEDKKRNSEIITEETISKPKPMVEVGGKPTKGGDSLRASFCRSEEPTFRNWCARETEMRWPGRSRIAFLF
jgi:hypothetical protein